MDKTFDVVCVVVDCFGERKEKKKGEGRAQEEGADITSYEGGSEPFPRWACDWGAWPALSLCECLRLAV